VKSKFVCLFFLLFFFIPLNSIKINRVILSANTNPTFMDFWPLVAKAWKEMGIQPTLALIEDQKNISIDKSLGDVMRFEPIEGVKPGVQAQLIRLLLPTYFEDDVCLISDIDILPLSKDYFVTRVKQYPENSFIVYRKTYTQANKGSQCAIMQQKEAYSKKFLT